MTPFSSLTSSFKELTGPRETHYLAVDNARDWQQEQPTIPPEPLTIQIPIIHQDLHLSRFVLILSCFY